jgi:hypothetical protein
MAGAIRKIGLKLVLGLLRAFSRPSRAGWRRCRRPPTLNGR